MKTFENTLFLVYIGYTPRLFAALGEEIFNTYSLDSKIVKHKSFIYHNEQQ